MDCFAVAVGICACRRQSWRDILLMAMFFGLFQGLMPVIGWMAGVAIQGRIEAFDHWIAFGLLAFIGGKMIIQSFRHGDRDRIHQLNFAVLLTLSVATSIDALVTGLSFGLIEVNMLRAGILIFAITFLVTVAGAKLGEKTAFLSAPWAERAGGTILILIGVRILAEHTGLF